LIAQFLLLSSCVYVAYDFWLQADLKDFTALLNIARKAVGIGAVAAPKPAAGPSKEQKARDEALTVQQTEYWNIRRALEALGYVTILNLILGYSRFILPMTLLNGGCGCV
jgi:hypothetical protein